MQKFHLGQKLLKILVFCLFEGNCRLLFDSTGDSATERSEKSLRSLLKNFRTVTQKVAGSNPARGGITKLPERTNDLFFIKLIFLLPFKIETKYFAKFNLPKKSKEWTYYKVNWFFCESHYPKAWNRHIYGRCFSKRFSFMFWICWTYYEEKKSISAPPFHARALKDFAASIL